jgi:hypothetical protein
MPAHSRGQSQSQIQNPNLDVFLEGDVYTTNCRCSDCGNNHRKTERKEYYWATVSNCHRELARAAEVYTAVWEPNTAGSTVAKQLIVPLTIGLAELEVHPEKFESIARRSVCAPYGGYQSFVHFIQGYLQACIEYPDATVRVSTHNWGLRD